MTDRELMQMAQNTDRELWREREGDFYADSIHVTKDGRIGMNVGGTVFVMTIKAWHEAAAMRDRLAQPVHAIDISQERVDETAKHRHEVVAWHEPGAYGNVTTHKDWALANGWEPLYKEKKT